MVIDVNEASFQDEVLARSHELPVIVDFWAEWCGPCRQLGPALEAAVSKRDGVVVLAKVDADESFELARTYQVQSIPSVKAFRDEEVVWEFIGVKPPKEIDELIDQLVTADAVKLVEAGDEASLRRALELKPEMPDASFLLAMLEYDRGELDAALKLLNDVPKSFVADGLRARIQIEQAGGLDLKEVFDALDMGELEKGLDIMLDVLPTAGGQTDRLRRVYVGVLSEFEPDDPTARVYRGRLAEALG